ncbi:hypothetical protein MCHI_003009 [Candidatus Magnetoovum chiemensis]|nr:hypothetical protein MCHI_003009 [Candidatus Magnetoovum chiemensis]
MLIVVETIIIGLFLGSSSYYSAKDVFYREREMLEKGKADKLASNGDKYINGKIQLVRELTLTDFSIWTEARYTRHPSQADSFTPFQDFPSSLEHFPAGSIISPADAYE